MCFFKKADKTRAQRAENASTWQISPTKRNAANKKKGNWGPCPICNWRINLGSVQKRSHLIIFEQEKDILSQKNHNPQTKNTEQQIESSNRKEANRHILNLSNRLINCRLTKERFCNNHHESKPPNAFDIRAPPTSAADRLTGHRLPDTSKAELDEDSVTVISCLDNGYQSLLDSRTRP